MSTSERRHLFVSHHHRDDAVVDKLLSLLNKSGWDVRNSSIRAKPANQERLDSGLVRPEVIRRLLQRKISWATTVVVLIGKETHTRPWVDWEIADANAKGKKIIGVFERGGTEADIPANLEKYASGIVAWNAESIQQAIDGDEIIFQNADGSPRLQTVARVTSQC